jgi:hypothetical protein
MTAADWLTTTDAGRMLAFVTRTGSERKLRLFAVACCQRVWDKIRWAPTREAIRVAELYADGLVGEQEVRTARQAVNTKRETRGNRPIEEIQASAAALGALVVFGQDTSEWDIGTAYQCSFLICDDYPGEWTARSQLLRCIFGNPFRLMSMNPEWLTTDVRALATGIYTDRAFDRMPILADALQDAGCTSDDILNHCRAPGAHARGCCVIDLVLR